MPVSDIGHALQLAKDVKAREEDILIQLAVLRDRIRQDGLPNLTPILPALLHLDGKPYSLQEYPHFESAFSTVFTPETLWITARQVAKTKTVTARGVLVPACIPNYKVLFIAPLFEQTRRLSTLHVKPYIDGSPIRSMLIDTTSDQNVLQRSYRNGSLLVFSFCTLTADRVRGLSRMDEIDYDEIQDLDEAHIPIIRETATASEYETFRYAGTPKTDENVISRLHARSSKAEWCIICRACNKLNVPRLSHDMEKMIGPFREDISPERPGLLCANPACRRFIYPRDGMWVHEHKERALKFPGYHVPQPVLTLHCTKPNKWATLRGKMESYGQTRFINEVLGEAHGTGTQLVTEEQLLASCDTSRINRPDDPRLCVPPPGLYEMISVGVDWGGGGEDEVSFTVITVCGIDRHGVVHVLWAKKLLMSDHFEEALIVREIVRLFGADTCNADYNGSGVVRDSILLNSGVPASRVLPMEYIPGKWNELVRYVDVGPREPRPYYKINRTRTILYLCGGIRTGKVKFFADDYRDEESPGLLRDFLALTENKVQADRGGTIYFIGRISGRPDDFVHATNYAAVMLWHATKKWPKFDLYKNWKPTEQQIRLLEPENPDWFGSE
jgi:hypothetical protein